MEDKGERYNKEFKDRVVRMIEDDGRSAASVSKDLVISEQTIYRWIEQHKVSRNPEKVPIMELEAELKAANHPLAFPCVVRRATKSDLPDIMSLYHDLEGAYGYTSAGGGEEQEKLWEQVSADSRQHILVGEIDRRIISTLTVIIIPNLGHRGSPWAAVENVVVDSSFRGQGIGTRLMAEAGRIAREHGCYKIVLTSNLSRRDSHDFYSRLGWRMTHTGFSLEPTD